MKKMKLIELKNYLKNAILKSLNFVEPVQLTPKSYVDRINLEYIIFDMKVELYQKCFSSIDRIYIIEPIFCFKGLTPIPKRIGLIKLKPINFVFIEELDVIATKFRSFNPQNRIDSKRGASYYDRTYSISNFIFRDDLKPLIEKINFEIHKLFVLDNLDKFSLKPYTITQYEASYYFCMQCGEFKHINNMNTKDFLICSIDCGMKMRGLSYKDFY